MTDSNVPAMPPGYRLFARDEVGSTNDEARDLIAAGVGSGTVVWAESQTAGRGRHGRSWNSPPGNLYCSIVLDPGIEQSRLGEVSFVAALAVRDAVAGHLPVETPVELKWPNDVLVCGRKIAGILVEAEKLPDEHRVSLILGVGINVVSAPAEASYPATSIAALARPPRVSRLLAGVVAAVDRRLDLWKRNGFIAVRDDWMCHAHGVGSQVSASTGISGTLTGLDEAGAIVISTTGGERHLLRSGSIRYI